MTARSRLIAFASVYLPPRSARLPQRRVIGRDLTRQQTTAHECWKNSPRPPVKARLISANNILSLVNLTRQYRMKVETLDLMTSALELFLQNC